MGIIKNILDLFFHLDEKLPELIDKVGIWVYVILFIIIFAETGLVVAPFLPGDSLLFAAGAISATGSLNIWGVYFTLLIAAIVGDTVNYKIGEYIGPKAFKQDSKFLKEEYLIKAQEFYEKHGPKSIVLARFLPIIRTFAPFVAGIGKMNYTKFISYNIFGAILWVTIFTWAGYFFGNIPFVEENFHYVVVLIILISLVPICYEVLNNYQDRKQQAKNEKLKEEKSDAK